MQFVINRDLRLLNPGGYESSAGFEKALISIKCSENCVFDWEGVIFMYAELLAYQGVAIFIVEPSLRSAQFELLRWFTLEGTFEGYQNP
mgnify:CR=1 FL=1